MNQSALYRNEANYSQQVARPRKRRIRAIRGPAPGPPRPVASLQLSRAGVGRRSALGGATLAPRAPAPTIQDRSTFSWRVHAPVMAPVYSPMDMSTHTGGTPSTHGPSARVRVFRALSRCPSPHRPPRASALRAAPPPPEACAAGSHTRSGLCRTRSCTSASAWCRASVRSSVRRWRSAFSAAIS